MADETAEPSPAALHRPVIVIQDVAPEVDGGRYAVKREVGDTLTVSATIFRDGHDVLRAVVRYRRESDADWREAPMTLGNPGLDRWSGEVLLTDNAYYIYTVEAWTDHFASWCAEAEKKLAAGQDIHVELIEARGMVAAAAARATGRDQAQLDALLAAVDEAGDRRRAELLLAPATRTLMEAWPDRTAAATYDREFEVFVDRVAARYSTWYEMFPRSQGKVPGKSATFDDCIARLPDIRSMGFDVVYLLPIHPIGLKHRKGRNNRLHAGPDDPGSPYAIGGADGGHTAIQKDLGTLADFRRFVDACHDHGMEVALDFAIQCAPDHPWVTEHPEWFVFRPDGSIKYAENPPKKYQDIVNLDMHGPHREAVWRALRDVVLFWIGQGVKIFRVDNPHTKPVPFWAWLIREVRREHPEVLFLSEAFTRPPMMKLLAKVGFSQSYTYFTWREFKKELIEYGEELTQTECVEYMRPNFFTNTPDILPRFLQTGGRPAFMIRVVLAATLSSAYGIYNGFELCENTAVEGTEDYLNSEKYEYKVWDWERPGHIKDVITTINRIRRENPALQELDNLRFFEADDESVLFYGKMTPDRGNMVFVAVNLDPFEYRHAELVFPLAEMGLDDDDIYAVEDLLGGGRRLWKGARHDVQLHPEDHPAAIFRIVPWRQIDYASPSD